MEVLCMTEKDVTISIPAGLTAKTVTVIVEKANTFALSASGDDEIDAVEALSAML